MKKRATFSPCRKYRYTLWRSWDVSLKYVMFIGLNPSTANEIEDDPTIRRCIRYAKDWGYSGLCMTNLFAFRATKPKDMKAAQYPIGTDNNRTLVRTAKDAGIIIAGWGIDGGYLRRDKEVIKMISQLHYLRLTKDGFPGHPLFLPKSLKPIKYKTSKKQKRLI